MLEIRLKPEKGLTNKELEKARKKNPDLKFKAEIKKGKQYITIYIDETKLALL